MLLLFDNHYTDSTEVLIALLLFGGIGLAIYLSWKFGWGKHNRYDEDGNRKW